MLRSQWQIRILQISTLQHEAFDDSVKDGPLEVKGLSTVPISLLSRAESPEVVRSLGNHIVEQLESDPTKLLAAKRDVQKATASLNTHSGSKIYSSEIISSHHHIGLLFSPIFRHM